MKKSQKVGQGYCAYHKCWHDAKEFATSRKRRTGLHYICMKAVNARLRDTGALIKTRLKLRTRVLAMYSTEGALQCAACGYKDIRALVLDHINGNGGCERSKIKGTCGIWRNALKSYRPDLYQVLCANCNAIKRIENEEHNPRPRSLPKYKRLAPSFGME